MWIFLLELVFEDAGNVRLSTHSSHTELHGVLGIMMLSFQGFRGLNKRSERFR
jgi:hypothetical protein